MILKSRLSGFSVLIASSLLIALAFWISRQAPACDGALLDLLANHRTAMLDGLFRIVTWAGSLYVLLPSGAAAGYLLIRRGHGQHAQQLACAVLGAAMLAYLLKFIVDRRRPVGNETLIQTSLDYAFPSNHATQATAFFLMGIIIIRALRPGWFRPAALIGALMVFGVSLSRIYLQVHYPTDVLAGVLTGILTVGACRLRGRDR